MRLYGVPMKNGNRYIYPETLLLNNKLGKIMITAYSSETYLKIKNLIRL